MGLISQIQVSEVTFSSKVRSIIHNSLFQHCRSTAHLQHQMIDPLDETGWVVQLTALSQ